MGVLFTHTVKVEDMKTYLLDVLNKYKRFSENLDVKTTLCNKSWWAFNDTGKKEVYIFQEDGSLIISINGEVVIGSWKYLAANKSLIISGADQNFMVNTAYMDNTLFALQVDGTEQYCFLIDQQKTNDFSPKSLDDLDRYFQKIIPENIPVIENIPTINRTDNSTNNSVELKSFDAFLKEHSLYGTYELFGDEGNGFNVIWCVNGALCFFFVYKVYPEVLKIWWLICLLYLPGGILTGFLSYIICGIIRYFLRREIKKDYMLYLMRHH